VAACATHLSLRWSSPGETEAAVVGGGADEQHRRSQEPVVLVRQRPGRVEVVDAVDEFDRSKDDPSREWFVREPEIVIGGPSVCLLTAAEGAGVDPESSSVVRAPISVLDVLAGAKGRARPGLPYGQNRFHRGLTLTRAFGGPRGFGFASVTLQRLWEESCFAAGGGTGEVDLGGVDVAFRDR
jgi:hypothetical protein